MSFTRAFLFTLATVLLLTALRIGFIASEPFDLFADEAQYWTWSKALDVGYYSKPPMIGWLIALTTSVCGDTPFCIRLSSPILHALTALVLFAISWQWWRNPRLSLLAAILYISLPAITVSSSLASTDPALLLNWSIGILVLWQALTTQQLRYWILFGVTLGIGFLSKYNMLFLSIIAVITVIQKEALWKHHKIVSLLTHRGLWSAAFIAFLIVSPNLWWNLTHQMATLQHIKEISIDTNPSEKGNALDFVLGQLVIGGPLIMALLLAGLSRFRQAMRQDFSPEALLQWLWIVPFVPIIFISTRTNAELNWSAPMYIAIVLLTVFLAEQWKKQWIVITSIVLHLGISFGFYGYYPLIQATGVTLHAKSGPFWQRDPFYRVHGWKPLGDKVRAVLQTHPNALLLVDERKILAELKYYARPEGFNGVKWPRDARIRDHYDLTASITQHPGKTFIFVSRYVKDLPLDMAQQFEDIIPLPDIIIPLYPDYNLHYYVHLLEGYKGRQIQ